MSDDEAYRYASIKLVELEFRRLMRVSHREMLEEPFENVIIFPMIRAKQLERERRQRAIMEKMAKIDRR